jgi:hypothetical protein
MQYKRIGMLQPITIKVSQSLLEEANPTRTFPLVELQLDNLPKSVLIRDVKLIGQHEVQRAFCRIL